MLKKTADIFTTAYLLILFCIYPLYIQNGYEDIGEAKMHFFLYVSLAAFGILGILAVFYLIRRIREVVRQKRVYLFDWDRVSATDLFVLLYATTVFLSYVLTDYRKEALWGTEGWYIGCVPVLLLCGLYFFISGMWGGSRVVLYGITAASALVFLFGIFSRFSVYPKSFETVQPDFISTLGNINWFCGYLSVVAPVGLVMFVLAKDGQKMKKLLFGSYALITFAVSFCQGGSSIFLWFFALFFMLLLICPEKESRMKNWALLLVLWGVSAQAVRLMRYLMPERYNYDTDNLCGYCTDSSFTLWIALAGAGLYLLFIAAKKRGRTYRVNKKRNRRVLLSGAAIFIGLCLLILLVNTVWGIPFIRENAILQKIFFFDKEWGNGRGAAFYAGAQAFKEMPFLHKLFGVGPDCFSRYVYSLPQVEAELIDVFGNSRLTNAHNELLTALVNTGILGVIFYLGIFISFVTGCLKEGKEDPSLYLFAVCVFCYLIHNMVSFAQVLNFPFLFLILGMGEAKRRKAKQNLEKSC